MEFVECSSCAAKPGAPTLCESCLSNRAVIQQFKQQIVEAKALIQKAVSIMTLEQLSQWASVRAWQEEA